MDHFVFRLQGITQDPQGPLVAAAWEFRVAEGLTSQQQLGAMNVTAWLYRDKFGKDEIYVRRNITINEIQVVFDKAATKQAEIGFHAEALAGQFFLAGISNMKVKEIFSDRIPCSNPTGGNNRAGCLQLLKNNFPGIPVYFMHNSYDTTAAGNVSAANALSVQYPKRTPYTFSNFKPVPETQASGRLPSKYYIYSL